MTLSAHAKFRMQQREISSKQVNFAVRCGMPIANDAYTTMYCVGREQLNRGHQMVPKGLLGLVVIVDNDSSTVVTVYRNPVWERHLNPTRR